MEKKTLKTKKVSSKKIKYFEVSGDILVPDVKPDIISVISVIIVKIFKRRVLINSYCINAVAISIIFYALSISVFFLKNIFLNQIFPRESGNGF